MMERLILPLPRVKAGSTAQLKLRIPAWAKSGYITTKDRSYGLNEKESNGYLTVTLNLAEGDQVEVFFDMPVRYTQAHNLVEEAGYQAAIEKGPLVYCMETQDNPVETLDDLLLNLQAQWKQAPLDINGKEVMVLEGEAFRMNREGYDREALYQELRFNGMDKVKIKCIPYFAWDKPGDMMR